MSTRPKTDSTPDGPKGIYLEIEGKTKRELWDNLVSLVSDACRSKQEDGNHDFPDMISTRDGMIKIVKASAAGNG